MTLEMLDVYAEYVKQGYSDVGILARYGPAQRTVPPMGWEDAYDYALWSTIRFALSGDTLLALKPLRLSAAK